MSQAERSHTTRRTLLAGAAAFTPALGISLTALARSEPADAVDALFRRWCALDTAMSATELSDADRDKLCGVTHGVAREIAASRASFGKAAALVMVELACGDLLLSDTPAQRGCRAGDGLSADMIDHNDEIVMAWSVLECLRPHLSGFVGEVAADFLDHPHRVVRESLLFTYDGATR